MMLHPLLSHAPIYSSVSFTLEKSASGSLLKSLPMIILSKNCVSSLCSSVPLSPGHIQYCRNHYANSHCDQGCNSAFCGWDGSDCFKHQSPLWAKGTLVLHTNIPHQRGTFLNNSLLWALSIVLQSPLKLRGSVPLATNKDLFDIDPQKLANLLAQAAPADSNGWVQGELLLPLWLDNNTKMKLQGC